VQCGGGAAATSVVTEHTKDSAQRVSTDVTLKALSVSQGGRATSAEARQDMMDVVPVEECLCVQARTSIDAPWGVEKANTAVPNASGVQ